ncbi:hypothetical protein EV1_003337 [Malus domestica]
MPLRDEFDTFRSFILHRTPLPSVDSVLNELQAKEVRVQSHRLSSSLSNTSTFTAARSRKVAMDECSYCKGKGHWKSQCPKLSQQHELPQKGGATVVLHIGTDSKSESRKDDWTW